jgi:hypothetical protein
VLQARLIEAGESADRAAHVASLFDRIEALRYAPGGDHAALQAAIEAVSLLLEPR